MNEQIEQFRDRIFPADSESLEEKIISRTLKKIIQAKHPMTDVLHF